MYLESKDVSVSISISDPSTQSFSVEISWVPTSLTQTIILPSWTPGSYKIRDHVQNLHSLKIIQKDTLLIPERTKINSWQLQLQSLDSVTIKYIIEAKTLTVRTCYIDPDFASLSLSAAIIQIVSHRYNKHLLNITKPSNWNIVLPTRTDNTRLFNNYDELVDTPIHASEYLPVEFCVEECKHKVLIIGTTPFQLPNSLISDFISICQATCKLMNTKPPSLDSYLFVLILLEKGYGGLEHDNASVIHYSWKNLVTEDGYRKFLQLIGHEYLHQWNVRRLRPAEYTVYDYSSVKISDSLWFAEGVTSYYDLALTLLAGRSDTKTFIKDLSDEFSSLFTSHGRLIHSLSDSSREAWVKLYNATASSIDTQVSYYRLGAAVAFCLDVRLRENNSSLASILRTLWNQFKYSSIGYKRVDIINAIKDVDGMTAVDLVKWLDIPGALPIQQIAKSIGLDFRPASKVEINAGLTLDDKSGLVRIIRVLPGSPAQIAGLVLDDELISIGGFRLRKAKDLSVLLSKSDENSVIYCRHGRIGESKIQSSKESTNKWEFTIDHNSTRDVITLREKWLEII